MVNGIGLNAKGRVWLGSSWGDKGKTSEDRGVGLDTKRLSPRG